MSKKSKRQSTKGKAARSKRREARAASESQAKVTRESAASAQVRAGHAASPEAIAPAPTEPRRDASPRIDAGAARAPLHAQTDEARSERSAVAVALEALAALPPEAIAGEAAPQSKPAALSTPELAAPESVRGEATVGPAPGSALEHLTLDARDAWDERAVESRLLEDRIMEAVATTASERPAARQSGRWARYGLMAAAASVLLALGAAARHQATPSTSMAQAPTRRAGAWLRSATGEVQVGDRRLEEGQPLHEGDEATLLGRGTLATFERPGRVLWAVSPSGDGDGARALLTDAGDRLTVALREGSVEASVAPVPRGEAFAVDVSSPAGTVRVAVHGTHLRVARDGDRVTVDLTEGVIAIGRPPRSGDTTGTSVAAPAHVELDLADPVRTLSIDREPAHVRPALAFSVAPRPVGETAARPSETTPPRFAQGREAPAKHAQPAADTTSAAVGSSAPAAPVPSAGRSEIVAAVAGCAKATRSQSDVAVTIASTLHLRVDQNGSVSAARFEPPLAPAVQTCAAKTIYRLTLEERGAVAIPLRFTY